MRTTKNKHIDPPFSVWVFAIVIISTLIAYFSAMRFIVPQIWHRQISASALKLIIVFLIGHLVTTFVEFFFHRYMLHRPFPFFKKLYQQHEYHHDLTELKLVNVEDGIGRVFNRYPILIEIQHDASYFPWYSLITFIGFSLIGTIPIQLFLTDWPILLGSALSITWAIVLYEIFHMTEHLSFEKFWKPKVTHPNWGSMWTSIYCFHMRHHADRESNENISAFFGFPIADLVFNTYAPWPKAFVHGEAVKKSDFASLLPKPCGLIRWLDRLMPLPQRKK